MKRLVCFMVVFASMIWFVDGVNAAGVLYTEGSWAAVSNDSCGNYNEVANSYTDYTFDKTTGLFALTGDTYANSQNSGVKKYVFYTTSSDKKTLYAYIPSYNNNVSFISSSLNIPAGSCDSTYKVSKTSSLQSSSTNDDSTTGNNQNEASNTNSENANDEENLQDELNVDTDDDVDENKVSNSNGTVQTSTNPSTGLSDYVIYLVPLAIIIGAVLVLKKKKVLNIR